MIALTFMKIHDVVYGTCEVKEPVLLDLICSRPIQRLKKINQYGLPYEYYPLEGFTRYEHSIGVMLLLRGFGAGIEEQVAALTHDASHTAFSHLVDHILGDPSKENFQDDNHENFIKNSTIPEILRKYSIDLNKIINLHNFGLLERPAPDLCADRLDYSLRELKIREICNVQPLLESLKVHNDEIVFDSQYFAEVFGMNYMSLQIEHWDATEYRIRWHLFSDALRTALKENIISKDDFYETDNFVIKKLKSSKNPEISKLLSILSGEIRYEIVKENPDIIPRKKFRWVDPKFLEEGVVKSLSEADVGYKIHLEKQKELNKIPLMVKLIS